MSDRFWAFEPKYQRHFDKVSEEMAASFGDFEAARVDGFWIVLSPDLKLMGMRFAKANGESVRVAIRGEDMQAFLTLYMATLEKMALASAEPEGAC